MVKISNIILIFNDLMPTPDTAFKLMVAYCKKTGKNMWEEFGYTFSATAKTVIILERKGDGLLPVGFCNLEYHSSDNLLFLSQGFLVGPIDDPSLLVDSICKKCSEYWNVTPEKMVIHSDLPERLWGRFGLKKSKLVIYEKQIGGN